jgi:hypothetical protein
VAAAIRGREGRGDIEAVPPGVSVGVGVIAGGGIGLPGTGGRGVMIGESTLGASGEGVAAGPPEGAGRLHAASIPAQASARRRLETEVFIPGKSRGDPEGRVRELPHFRMGVGRSAARSRISPTRRSAVPPIGGEGSQPLESDHARHDHHPERRS